MESNASDISVSNQNISASSTSLSSAMIANMITSSHVNSEPVSTNANNIRTTTAILSGVVAAAIGIGVGSLIGGALVGAAIMIVGAISAHQYEKREMSNLNKKSIQIDGAQQEKSKQQFIVLENEQTPSKIFAEQIIAERLQAANQKKEI